MDFNTTSSKNDFLVRVGHDLAYLIETPDALARMDRFGYTVQRLQEGKLLLDQASAAFYRKQQLQMQQKLETDRFHAEWKLARQRYKVHLTAARSALGREADALLSKMPNGYSRWLGHARSFYAAVLGNLDYLAKMSSMTIPMEELQRSSQTIEALAERKTQQMKARSIVRTIHQRRDAEMEALHQWFMELIGVARIALRKDPGMLDALHGYRRRAPEKIVKEETTTTKSA
ncbi:MAG: hypothetical protein U0175_20475 [Caldilineaceae bacterium]